MNATIKLTEVIFKKVVVRIHFEIFINRQPVAMSFKLKVRSNILQATLKTSIKNMGKKMPNEEVHTPLNMEEHVVLPRDIFHSQITYLIYQLFNSMAVRWVLVINAILITGSAISIHKKNEDAIAIFLLLAILFFIGSFSFVIVRIVIDQSLDDAHIKMKLYSEVLKYKPNINLKSWNIITFHMNEYLYQNGYFRNPFCLYDSSKCYNWFLELTNNGTIDGSGTASNDSMPEPTDLIDAANDETAPNENSTANVQAKKGSSHSTENALIKYKLSLIHI